mmetsp:Transcript_36994/g.54321  ORF Transcript_36994/g.54321 Transcript_36994/m.54321 type:complete len:339 (-) Transcript_36994:231-1247(-)|eukprot:CAMPEP_0195525242 /NCGR_PEP_ID=MMETSP0794_2-20130614/25575_1 /TAXON_ID=515487 /ORGANISM="Stephanopyxis turris, Strain CCMP 815" /LENGTH=338 /DNA_ID=CAMNT_0040655653 /DNA_START=203 /DNA_END=1219 /DNA_ORIENTATION=+
MTDTNVEGSGLTAPLLPTDDNFSERFGDQDAFGTKKEGTDTISSAGTDQKLKKGEGKAHANNGTNRKGETTQPLPVDADAIKENEVKTMDFWQFMKLVAVSGATIIIYVTYGATMGLAAVGTQAEAVKVFLYVAGGIGMAVSPVAIVNEVRLAKKNSVRKLINFLRLQVNRTKEENAKLTIHIDNMKHEVEQTAILEKKLANVTVRQGRSVESFVGMVKENGRYLKEMKKICKSRALQILITLVLNSDTERNFSLNEKATQILLLRLKQIEYIHFDEEKIRKDLGTRPSVSHALYVVKNIVREDLKEDQAVFSLAGVDLSKDHKLRKKRSIPNKFYVK